MIHRAHDYSNLIQRWRRVARQARLIVSPLAVADRFELFSLRSPALEPSGGLYISAGIHGDEPASTEGLISWAERHVEELAGLPLFLLPCLNPWGLVGNSRFNETGVDLNRAFDNQEVPVIVAICERLAGQSFEAAVMLHEDYDGQGVYLYEGVRAEPFWGEAILRAASEIIPIDGRTRIDIGRPKRGIMRRRFDAGRYARLGGLPEAIYLQRNHARRTITFETPSEFALERRVEAQIRCVEACFRMMESGR